MADTKKKVTKTRTIIREMSPEEIAEARAKIEKIIDAADGRFIAVEFVKVSTGERVTRSAKRLSAAPVKVRETWKGTGDSFHPLCITYSDAVREGHPRRFRVENLVALTVDGVRHEFGAVGA